VGWIGGKAFDLVFFFGSGLFGVAAGVLAMAAPSLVVPLWLVWLFLLDGPHLAATFTRTYLDPTWLREHRALGLGSLLLLTPGFVAFGAAKALGSPLPYDLFLLFATIWAFHHAVRQHYGILAIYQRHARPSPRERRIDTGMLYLSYWGLIGVFLFGHPKSRLVLQLPETLPPWGHALLVAAGAALGAALVAYVGYAILRARRGADPRPMLFLLLPVVAQQAFGLFVVGAAEPLIARPSDPEQYFLAVAVVGGTVHGMQYLGIVVAANRRRATAPLGQRPWILYGVLVAASILYMAVNLTRGASPWTLFASGTDQARLFLALYWGIFFHHYYIDQKIWHPGSDPALRRELGLSP
jgi:hypothetical protein